MLDRVSFIYLVGHWRNREGEAAGLQPPPKAKLKKKTDFVDTMLSKVLRDLPFSLNQPWKLADN